jgi:hypothetical protein
VAPSQPSPAGSQRRDFRGALVQHPLPLHGAHVPQADRFVGGGRRQQRRQLRLGALASPAGCCRSGQSRPGKCYSSDPASHVAKCSDMQA